MVCFDVKICQNWFPNGLPSSKEGLGWDFKKDNKYPYLLNKFNYNDIITLFLPML